MNFNTILTVINILVMGATGVGFIRNVAKQEIPNVLPLVEKVQALETKDAAKTEQINTLVRDVAEVKGNVKDIRDLLYEERGFNKTSVSKNFTAPLITGTANGAPISEHD